MINRFLGLIFSVFVSSIAVSQPFVIPLSGIASIGDKRSSQIIEHTGYTVSYNPQLHIPNWVAYELTAEEVKGTVSRKGNAFFPDPEAEGVVISTYDYSGSGYDRGHMAPAGDMKWSKEAMMESFYLSNICPQNPNLNGGDWRILEEKVRVWAGYYQSIYVVCGPLVSKKPQTIGTNKIAVPDAFFKVLLRFTDKGVETIGFIFKNEAGHKPLTEYMVTVDEVEKLTGIDFFSILPDAQEKATESTYCAKCW
ncbi:MAG: DNA/RNA non-specific endonuclease [Bacteroidales bacterium]|nr:DNA/RNA non-specific endonuclease [Bacteroidales bacterium]